MKIDWQKIDHFCNVNPKPVFVKATDDEWREALKGTREHASEMDVDEVVDGEQFGTNTLWTLIWFSTIQYFKGRESSAA